MSNRLTFSLASLIVILAFAFSAMPVLAAPGGPTVTITEYTGKETVTTNTGAAHVQERGDFRVKLTFSHPVQGPPAVGTVPAQGGDADGLVGSTIEPASVEEVTATNGVEYVATYDLSAILTATEVKVTIIADSVDGSTLDNDLGNQPGSGRFTLPPVLGAVEVTVTDPKEATPKVPGRYTVTFTFGDGATAPAETFANSHIKITPKAGANVVAGTLADQSSATPTMPGKFTADIKLEFGTKSVTVEVDPGYAKPKKDMGSVTLPPPVAAKQNPPMVTLEIVDHDEDEMSFHVRVETTPTADSDGEKGTKIKGAAIKAKLKIMDADEDEVDLMLRDNNASNEDIKDNSYEAVLEYGLFDKLPLTVSIDPNDLAHKDADDVDPVTATVGEATSGPDDEDEDPTAEIVVSGVDVSKRTFTVEVMLTPGMKAGGSAGDPIKGFDREDLAIMGENDSTPRITVVDEDKADNSYLAELQWNSLSTRNLPFTVKAKLRTDGTDQVYYKDTSHPTMDAMATVARDGTDPVDPVDPTDPAAPAAPTDVTATANQDTNTVTLTWTASAGATGYKIAQTGHATANYTDPDNMSPFMTPALEPGTYSFTVMATKGELSSDASAPVPAMINMDPVAPDAPTNVTATPDQAANTVLITWTPPANTGGAAITGYTINQTGKASRSYMAGATATSRTTGVLAVGVYAFTVMAHNSAGISSPPSSPPAPATIDMDAPVGAPMAPTGLSAMVNDNNSVTLTWTEPAGAVTYQVDVTNQATNRVNSNRISKASAHTTSVLPAGRYLIAVAAFNAARQKGDSASVQVTITPVPPSTPTRPATIEIPTSRSSSPLIALPSVMIPARGYLVLVRDETESGTYTPTNWKRQVAMSGLPDLELFFRNGGTIALMGTGAQNQRDVVISEIMWGSDSSLAAPEYSQWIEFYNTTPNDIPLAGFGIQFHRSDVPATAWAGYHDLVANSGFHVGYWNVPGQSGRTNPVDTLGRFAGTVPLHSMYRNINYTRVENPAHVANRGERLKDFPGGTGSGSWKKSESPNANIGPQWIATPGAPHQLRVTPANTTFARRVIITEIGNSDNDAYDWIELYNTTAGTINLKKWAITRVEKEGSVGKEHRLFFFPDNNNIEIPAKSHLVIAASNPTDDGNDLAAGIRINTSDANQLNTGLGSKVGIGHHANNTTAYYYVNSGFKLPNDNNRRLIVLRTANDKQGQPTHVEDFIGTLSIALRGELPSGWTWHDANARRFFNTATWPFQGAGGRHGNVIDGTGDEDFRPGRVIQRNDFGNGFGEKDLSVRGYTGIGYDRHAPVNAENGGTPGYSKDAIKSKTGEVAGTVTISEIMLATEEKRDAGRLPRATRLPQWFELYNGSLTQAVNVNNWYLEIQNADSDDLETRNLSGTLRLPNVIIQPNQTILIVSDSGLNSGNFPAQRTINLYTNSTYRSILNLRTRGDSVLSQVGFYIELRDHENKHVDEIGNLGYSRRAGANRADNFDNEWAMPSLNSEEGYRTSLLRVYDKGVARDGLMAESWRRASDTNFRYVTRSLTYFGNQNDFGTPGYRGGGPLPVSLSKFRPQRLDTGEVVIHWTTESELNNAGFNILRTEKRDGVFEQVNTELIKGHGTTSERNTYTWTDTSAKPNVIYYYQIQDVSLDGQVQTLRISRLKGNVSAAGKVTTTWGELKSLQ